VTANKLRLLVPYVLRTPDAPHFYVMWHEGVIDLSIDDDNVLDQEVLAKSI